MSCDLIGLLIKELKLSEKYGVHVCGEGGEYETFTLDCPLFKKRLVIDTMETVIHSADAFAPVGYLHFSKMHTEDKENGAVVSVLPLDLPSCSPRSSRGYQWISGITGLHSPDPGIQSQTTTAFTLLQGELERRDWQLKHIVLVHLVCVQAPLPAGQLLQMDCLLHDWPPEPQEAAQEATFHHREALHVQSLSHWAPANIGPYSQAFRI
ncbi:unnamed protein product [Coregonus sp. 'balchen']|nr:unnamed protein product [Coregonus sp. 'balchen']